MSTPIAYSGSRNPQLNSPTPAGHWRTTAFYFSENAKLRDILNVITRSFQLLSNDEIRNDLSLKLLEVLPVINKDIKIKTLVEKLISRLQEEIPDENKKKHISNLQSSLEELSAKLSTYINDHPTPSPRPASTSPHPDLPTSPYVNDSQNSTIKTCLSSLNMEKDSTDSPDSLNIIRQQLSTLETLNLSPQIIDCIKELKTFIENKDSNYIVIKNRLNGLIKELNDFIMKCPTPDQIYRRSPPPLTSTRRTTAALFSLGLNNPQRIADLIAQEARGRQSRLPENTKKAEEK